MLVFPPPASCSLAVALGAQGACLSIHSPKGRGFAARIVERLMRSVLQPITDEHKKGDNNERKNTPTLRSNELADP
jgi:hypothetical protein